MQPGEWNLCIRACLCATSVTPSNRLLRAPRRPGTLQIGVRLTKELFAVAGQALKINVTTLGPMVLPLSEQLIFFFNLVARKVACTPTAPTNGSTCPDTAYA